MLLTSVGQCTFCEVPVETDAARRRQAEAGSGSGLGEHEWRREVTRRLGDYRARRGHLRPAAELPQSGLPFRPVKQAPREQDARERERPQVRSSALPRKTERVEICVQPELDFSSFPDDRAHPQTALVPVASLAERRSAGALDALFIGLTGAGFLGLFHALGGVIALAKSDALVCAASLYLFYSLYFFLFTSAAGATPGMQIRGLTAVRLDGSLPDTKQLLWRSFGYLLSGATLLGFVWALWDEDHFAWQDRISHTYITAATPFATEATEMAAPARSFGPQSDVTGKGVKLAR